MTDDLIIRPARAAELGRLREIEVAAGRIFESIGMAAIAADEPPSVQQLGRYQADGRCWVQADADDLAMAYLIVEEVDGCCHVEQVSVHPDVAGRGLGRQLLDRAERWAVQHGLAALTLTTFVDVAWNGPYYRRCGFRFLDPDEETEGLRAIRASERDLGLDRWPRACMRREIVKS